MQIKNRIKLFMFYVYLLTEMLNVEFCAPLVLSVLPDFVHQL